MLEVVLHLVRVNQLHCLLHRLTRLVLNAQSRPILLHHLVIDLFGCGHGEGFFFLWDNYLDGFLWLFRRFLLLGVNAAGCSLETRWFRRGGSGRLLGHTPSLLVLDVIHETLHLLLVQLLDLLA